MAMGEDFGWSGDEFLIGDCQDDWLQNDRLIWQERQREREVRAADLAEEEVDNAWDAENERDLFDLVRENEEEEDWLSGDDDDYLNCSWEE
jgi:hypothetical protein